MVAAAISVLLMAICAMVKLTPLQFIILYSFNLGFMYGICVPAMLRAGWSHLEERKGLVSGTVLSAAGIGGFYWSIIFNKFCNPEDYKFVFDGNS